MPIFAEELDPAASDPLNDSVGWAEGTTPLSLKMADGLSLLSL